jgi:peptide/nickel transport system ATP-binding protein
LDQEIARLLGLVGLTPDMADRSPLQLSGGQRQRVAIARAMSLSPRLVVCDEPTSALDLSTQSQTLNLLRRMHKEHQLSYLFISHDLDVVRYISDRIAVLYCGQIMEIGAAVEIADDPQHPYTRMLVSAAPVPDPLAQADRRAQRRQLIRQPAAETAHPSTVGCPFAPRCIFAADVCWTVRPSLLDAGGDRSIACHLFDPDSGHPKRRERIWL